MPCCRLPGQLLLTPVQGWGAPARGAGTRCGPALQGSRGSPPRALRWAGPQVTPRVWPGSSASASCSVGLESRAGARAEGSAASCETLLLGRVRTPSTRLCLPVQQPLPGAPSAGGRPAGILAQVRAAALYPLGAPGRRWGPWVLSCTQFLRVTAFRNPGPSALLGPHRLRGPEAAAVGSTRVCRLDSLALRLCLTQWGAHGSPRRTGAGRWGAGRRKAGAEGGGVRGATRLWGGSRVRT